MKKTLIALMTLAGVAMGDTYWSFEGTLNSAGDNTLIGNKTGTVTLINTTETTGSIMGDASTNVLGLAGSFVDGSYIKATSPEIVGNMGTGTSGTSSFTVMTFVKFDYIPNGNDTNVFFFGTGSTNTGGIALGIADDGKVDFLVKFITIPQGHKDTPLRCMIAGDMDDFA